MVQCRTYHKLPRTTNPWGQTVLPRAGFPGYTSAQIAQLYSFPKISPVPSTPTIALIELGGGYNIAQMQSWCSSRGIAMPNLTSVSVDGATNSFTNNGSGSDGEVVLDICVVAGAYFYSTGMPANILVVFAPNTNQGFIDAINAVGTHSSKPIACGISWGSSEDQWGQSAIQAMDAAFAAYPHVTFCCAAGDNGSGDGEQGLHVDYPGSSSYVICCGGTTITTQTINGVLSIMTETVWNEGGGASGGGYSVYEALPAYQENIVLQSNFRGVPDVAMDADPASGYDTPFGVIGGTSAVAPLMAAYVTVASIPLGRNVTNIDLYKNESCFRDITSGEDGQYSAGPGWDPASGLGALIGTALLAKLQTGTPIPPPAPIPTPIPIPLPPTVPVPGPTGITTQQILSVIDAQYQQLVQAYARHPVVVQVLAMDRQYYEAAIVKNFGS